MEDEKYLKLQEYLKSLKKIAVAYSSGVDSTFLLKVAVDTLGKENVVAITAVLASCPKRETKEAIEFCKEAGITHELIEIDELKIEGFASNPVNRCYICKKAIFQRILEAAAAYGISYVAEGSNMDDNGDYRPGHIAIKELGIKSPLRAAELTKSDIRKLSNQLGLPTWNKPSFACLSSRFAYGETISKEKLMMVDRAEQLLYDMGFEQFRVRIHGDKNYIARIEILPKDMDKLMEESNRQAVYSAFKEYGFVYISVDLLGYRTGSMNEQIVTQG